MRALLGRVFFIVGSSLLSLVICHVPPSWPAEFLLRNQLIILWEFLCMLFVAFNIFFFVFNFCQLDYYFSQHVPPWVYPAWASLQCLDLGAYFLFCVRKVFSYYLFKYFLRYFLSFPFGSPIMQILVHLMLPQRSLRLFSFHLVLFSLFCSVAVISPVSFLGHLFFLPHLFCYYSF